MKKVIASVLCFAMCAGLMTGCSDKKDETTTTAASNGGETTTTASEGGETSAEGGETSAEESGETSAEEGGETTAATDEEHALSFGEGDIVIKVYAMSNEVPNMLGAFLEKNPDLKAKYKIDAMYCNNDGQGYETKLNAALTAGGDTAPDLYVAEADYILPYTTGDFASFAAPYADFIDNVDGKIKDAEIAGYTVELGTNADGKVQALCYQCTGGAMIYRASIAKEVFGSDDPAAIEEAFGAGSQNWDKFWEAADKLKAANVAVVSGLGDIWNISEKASQTPWVVDGKLNIDPQREAYIEMAKKLIDGGYTNDTTAWQPAWNADMRGEGDKKVFAYFGPAWLINYVMAGQCEGTDAYGDWRVCTPPVGFWWGGSWLLANKQVLDNADKKEFVSKFIEWVTLDASENGLQNGWANGTSGIASAKDTVSSGKVMATAKGDMEFLGGQNPFDIFVKATSFASAKCKCEYDADLNGTFQDLVNQYAHGKITKDELMDKFNDTAEAKDIEV